MTTLEELTKDFPDRIRLSLRETLDRTRIKNPNDPIFELMIVLGIWAKYYESIPSAIRSTGESATQSLDSRITLLKQYAQTIQSAVDRLDLMPQQIVNKFPSDTMAQSIATKINDQFKHFPLIKLETELRSLESSVKKLLGPEGGKGLAKELEEGIKRLDERAKQLHRSYIENDLGVAIVWLLVGAIIGALIASAVLWFSKIRPMEDKLTERQSYYYR